MSRRPHAVLAAAALAVAPLAALAPTAAAAEPTSVTLVGSLQGELGCADDWLPDCTATHLADTGTTWTGTFTVPKGSYEFKVAINDGWAENYGAGGVKDGPNIPLVLEGDAQLAFSYDEATHVISFTPLGLAGGTTPGDAAYAMDSLRAPLTKERFYFVMADRFANGDKGNDTGGLTGGPLVTGFDPTHKGFYHGGDLKGLTSRLDYIKGMGTTAI